MHGLKLFQVAITYECNKSCNYCFANSLKHEFSDMTLEGFNELLDWMKIQGVQNFNFTGGEPTIHPHFREMIDKASARDFHFTVFTNGLFDSSLIPSLAKADSLLVNYNPKSHYIGDEYLTLQSNLKACSEKNIKMDLQFNITDNVADASHILEAVQNFNVDRVNMDLIVPNSIQSNCFIEKEDYFTKKQLLISLIKELKENNVLYRVSRPLPRCIFSAEELRRLSPNKEIYFACGSAHNIITINPDLTMFPCLSIFYRGPKVTTLKSVDEFRDFYRGPVQALKWKKPFYDKCANCVYKARKQCQGACLGHKCTPFNTVEKGQFVVRSQFPPEEIKTFISTLESALLSVDLMFDTKPAFTVYIFDNRDDLLAYSGIKGYPDWATTFTNPKSRLLFHLGSSPNPALIHELTHLYIANRQATTLPLWFVEGLCEHVAGRDKAEPKLSTRPFDFDKLSDDLPNGFFSIDNSPPDRNVCYQQSHLFVRWLVQKFGFDIVNLLISSKGNFTESFARLTGSTLKQCQDTWLTSL